MASDRETLLSMGFDPARVDWALRATNGRGLQPAMDHLLAHEGEAVPTSGGDPAVGASTTGVDEDEEADVAELGINAGGVEAKSIKCSICDKTFRNTALANFHAEKSGHDQFEESTDEIKPLTEDEKREKLAELREKMAAKRALKTEQDTQEAKEKEKIRRKQGNDMNKIKEDLKAKEIIKEVEQRRQDKIEDAKARAAVRAQIEADKKARAEKAAREKALREGRPIVDASPAASSTAPPATPAASSSSGGGAVSGKDFKDTRLQIRLASGGTPYVTTLPSDSTLHDVAEYVAAQTLSVSVDTVSFTQHFPRKTFTRAEFGKTLKELGLTPSAVLIAS
ncbi:ubiquitin-related domain-containing protein [Boletus reticuloceps]|uniref:Ubiquitin-related domain-containing protein n=1 Tax=Boletus reticuloceps TaxID=495285 RepID=A0A8I3ADR1_9AGAM|nr:ubiquitin-related domain-containing protein [Boletus reticuloceps]